MGTAAAFWLALLATSQAPASDVSYLSEREFQIPITLPNDPAFQAEIDQLFLYVSTDEGKTWRQEAVASPRDKQFPFYARQDGSYWFNVSVQDKMKRSFPPDITKAEPALKVVVDTKKPVVKFTATERQGDVVTVSWEIRDEHVDMATCQLEYSTSEAPTWYMVPVTSPSLTGQKRWSMSTPGKVTVRLTVEDLAGNVGVTTADLASEPPPALALNSSSPPPPAAPAMHRPPAAPVESPFPTQNWQKNPVPNEPAPMRTENPAYRQPEPPARMASYNTPPAEEVTLPRVIATSKMPPAPAAWTAAHSPHAVSPASVEPTPPRPRRSKSAGPPMQYANQLHLDLNYEAKAGPSGIGEVQLWMTQDEGHTWRRFAEDPDLESPFAVDVPGEGTYGFSLVIRSKGGIYKGNKQTPLPGEAPEVSVEVDCTAPVAEMYAVEADPRRKDALFLQWKASDKNLAAKPISLRWAEKPAGPWQDIAVDIPNTGRHEWLMPAKLPYRIFLRLEVRDLAGNTCVAETDQPVLVDLVEPDGGITGIMTAVNKSK
jgi:hypothetical protein